MKDCQPCYPPPSQLREVKTLRADGTGEGGGQAPRTDKTVRTRGAQNVGALPDLAAPETLCWVWVIHLGQGKGHLQLVTNTNKL